MIKKDFSTKITEFKSKNNQEKLAFLSKFWKFDINREPFKLIGTYKKSEKTDKNGKEYGFFTDVRSINGNILYYPFKFGQVRIWVEHRDNLFTQDFWLFDVALSKKVDNNPFQLNLANKTFEKPSKTVLDKIDTEKNIENIVLDKKEEKSTTETYSLQDNHTHNNMNKTVIQQPQTVSHALDALLDNMYISNVHNRLRQLDHPQENDSKRWIWELIQNAKDSIVQDINRQTVDIKVIVKGNTIVFMHNGSPFTAEAQMGLLYKYSGKKGNDSESTGRFGTGFLTTHTLSKIVSIEGDLYTDDSKSNLCGFSATMYRNGINAQELLGGVEKMRESMIYTKELNNWTTYTYHLETDDNKKALELGLKNFIQNIAQVMLFCKELNTVELDNNGAITKIIRKQSLQLDNEICISEFEITGNNPHTRKFAHKKLSKHSEELTKRFKTDRNLRLMVAIEIDNENNLVENETAPSHFCVLPLVGSEKHIMPIYLNSPDFEPDSERESLLLDGSDNWEEHSELGTIITVRGINRLILKESIELYDSLVSYLSENGYHKLFLLAKGMKRTPDFEKNFNKEWFENEMVLPYREVLKKYAIVEIESGNQKLFNDDNTPNIIIPQGSKEVRQKIYSLATEISTNRLPLEIYASNWSYLAWDECGLFGIDDLCKYVADKQNASYLPSYEWLNKFLQFIKETDEILLKKYALVPNSNGDFVSLETDDFAEGVGLTEFMLDTLLALGIDLKPNLLSTNITAINLPIKVDAKNIAEKIDEQADCIIKDKDLSIEEIVENLRPLININLTDKSKFDGNFIEKQQQINGYIRVVFENLQVERIDNNDISEKAWQSTHKWLIFQLIESVSEYNNIDSLPKQINDKIQWLNYFIAFVSKEIKEGKLDEVAIIPNQNGDFCFKKDLSLDDNIPEILKTEQAENFGLLLKDSLLHKEINSVNISSKKDINSVIEIINSIFRNNKFENKLDDLDFAIYLLHFLPDESNQILFNSQKSLLNIVRKYYYERSESNHENTIICNSEDFWRKANDEIISSLQWHIAEDVSLEGLKQFLSESGKEYDNGDTIIFLNDFYDYLTLMKIPIDNNIIPNQNGKFCSIDDLYKDNDISEELKEVLLLCDSENDFKDILVEKSLSIQPKQNKEVSDIAKLVDDAIKDTFADSRNWEDENFKKAVALLIEYFKKHKDSKEIFSYSYSKRDSIELNVLLSEKDREIIQSYLKGELGLDQVKQKDIEIAQLKEENTKLKNRNEELEKLLAEKVGLEKEIKQLKEQLENATAEDAENIKNILTVKEKEYLITQDAIFGLENNFDDLGKKAQEKANFEAKRLVKERLEKEYYVFPANYFEQYSTIEGVTKDSIEYPLVVKSYEQSNKPLKIGANEWIQLMKPNSIFWVHFGNGKLGVIKMGELFRNQEQLSLTFNTSNLDAFRFSEEDMSDLVNGNFKGLDIFGKLLHYFNGVHFNFTSIKSENYSTADNLSDYRFDTRQTEEDITDNNSDSML
jgi:hypothetical protein